MPTPLNNQASIRYNYSGAGTGTAVSNTVTTNLLDRYTLAATKTPLSSTFRPGENVTYVIRVENNGSGDLYNVTIADDLGGGADTPLVYNPASLRAYVDSIPVTISPVVQGGTLTAVLPAPLPAGTAAILVYTAQVRPDVDFTLQSITNTVAVTANGGSAAGPAVTVTPSPTATLLRDSYAEVTLYKEADKQSVMAGEPLTYTFTLTNQGNQAADSVTLTDQLPTGFSVTQVSVSAGGATTVLAPGDYTVAIPSTTGKAIAVPAATVAAPGIATVAITGTVAGVTP